MGLKNCLDEIDHWLVQMQGVGGVVRYLDDLAVFAGSAAELDRVRLAMASHLQGRRLVLHPAKTLIASTLQAQRFLGMDLLPGGYRRLPPQQLGRALSRLALWRKAWQAQRTDEPEVRRSLQSWVAHARHADTYQLRCRLFPHGWFAPGEEPPRLRTPVARRRVEQQPSECALGQPQPRRAHEPQQQHRLASCP